MAKRMTKAEKISKTPFEVVAKLKGESGRQKLIKDVRTLRSAYKRRVGSFKRNGVISQAQIAFERDMPTSKKAVQLTKMSRNQLIYEFFRYASFFNSETSSIKGIEKVNREQDIRVFGADSKGRPKQRMTNQERELFWDTFEEYKNQFPADVNLAYSSEFVQQTIADALFGPEKIASGGLVSALTKIRQRLEEAKVKENMTDVPNTFAGRRNTFDW